jgi:predicted Zn-dependent protease
VTAAEECGKGQRLPRVERCAEKRGEQTVGTHTVTAERLHALAKLYEQGPVSDLMERTLEKLLRHEADACQTQLRQLQADLAEFEQKYQRSSTEFYQQFQAGQMGDAMDYVEWASLIQMTDNLTKRLRLLRGEASG